MALRVMVVDDEPLATERLSDLLAKIDDVDVVGAEQNALDALNALRQLRPELVLIDVEMPRMDGFDFVEALGRQGWLDPESAPCICFVTAYPQFASDAYETGALDFLCKPVRLARLEKTIARARLALAQRDAFKRLQELTGQLQELREWRAPVATPSLWVHQRDQMVRVAIETLEWIGAEGEYARLHVGEQSFLMRSSISALDDQLSAHGFIRIHRSTIVNHARVAAVKSTRAGMKVVLASSEELSVGRKYRPAIRSVQFASKNGLSRDHGSNPEVIRGPA
jgi:DNA-binding LytR/AlgR family response regulator